MFMQARKELPSNKKLSPNKRQSQNKGLSCQKELHPAGGLYSIQRKVSIVGLGELRDEQQQEIAADMGAFLQNGQMQQRFSRLYTHYINDREDRQFDNRQGFVNFMQQQIGLAAIGETMEQQVNHAVAGNLEQEIGGAAVVGNQERQSAAQRWFDHPDTQGVIELNPQDPLFLSIKNAIMLNAQNAPYPTDPKHEVVPSSPSPNIEISRIQMIKNPTQLREYENARQDISRRGETNEAHLFSGHREEIVNAITTQGHRPDIGAYGAGSFGKGHGALGRGAYFTDNVSKAVSYARAHNRGQAAVQQPDDGTEHSFLLQDVLLGNVLYGNGFPFRHAHLNEMVRTTRTVNQEDAASGVVNQEEVDTHAINHTREEGKDTPVFKGRPMNEYDSIVSARTHDPGEGMRGVVDRAINGSFDSNEYLIRNADQVYVRFRVFYTLHAAAAPAADARQPAYPITQIGDITVRQNAVHLPGSWMGKRQRPTGEPVII